MTRCARISTTNVCGKCIFRLFDNELYKRLDLKDMMDVLIYLFGGIMSYDNAINLRQSYIRCNGSIEIHRLNRRFRGVFESDRLSCCHMISSWLHSRPIDSDVSKDTTLIAMERILSITVSPVTFKHILYDVALHLSE